MTTTRARMLHAVQDKLSLCLCNSLVTRDDLESGSVFRLYRNTPRDLWTPVIQVAVKVDPFNMKVSLFRGDCSLQEEALGIRTNIFNAKLGEYHAGLYQGDEIAKALDALRACVQREWAARFPEDPVTT